MDSNLWEGVQWRGEERDPGSLKDGVGAIEDDESVAGGFRHGARLAPMRDTALALADLLARLGRRRSRSGVWES